MSLDPKKTFGANELEWAAFCYVSDELSGTERKDFEDRLAEDQEVRDAVVRVMELAELTYHCFDCQDPATDLIPEANIIQPKQVGDVTARRPAPGLLFAAAACVAMIAFGWGWQIASNDKVDSMANATRDIADAWSGLEDWGDSDRLAQSFAVGASTDENLASADGEPYLSDLQAESVDWMLVALMDIENQEGGQSQ